MDIPKRRTGRPLLAATSRLDSRVDVALTVAERAALEQLAAARGQAVSYVAREAIRQVISQVGAP